LAYVRDEQDGSDQAEQEPDDQQRHQVPLGEVSENDRHDRSLRRRKDGVVRGAALVDCKGIQRELGVTRAAAEAIMRRLDTVQIEDLRKVYVRRSDVLAYVEARTFSKDRVAA
jgi:hypothetical protein